MQTQSNIYVPETVKGHTIAVGGCYTFEDLNNPEISGLVCVVELNHEECLVVCRRIDVPNNETTLLLVPEEIIESIPSASALREQARDLFGRDGELEIDDNNAIQRIDSDTYRVECWVWVPSEALDFQMDADITEEKLQAEYCNGARNIDTIAEVQADARASIGDDEGAYVTAWITFSPDRLQLIGLNSETFIHREPEKQSRVTTLDVPEFYQDADFVRWLNHPDTNVLTWHIKGAAVNECSDVMLKIDGACNGDGDAATDMPEHLWDILVDYCREQLGVTQSDDHYLLIRNMKQPQSSPLNDEL